MRAEFPQAKTDPALTVALCLGALRFERTGGAIGAFVDPPFRFKAVLGMLFVGADKVKHMTLRAGKGIALGLIGPEVAIKRFGLEVFAVLLVEGVVLEIVADLFLLQIGIVFLTAIGAVSHHIVGQLLQLLFDLFLR